MALCVGNSPDTGEFPSQRPVTESLGVFFDLHLKKRLSKQSSRWWFETPSRPIWRHFNGMDSRTDTAYDCIHSLIPVYGTTQWLLSMFLVFLDYKDKDMHIEIWFLRL